MTRPMRFREDGVFVIAQFTDLHVTTGLGDDRRTLELMDRVLVEERPDMAVLTGDVVFGAGNDDADPTLAWQLAVRPLEERGVPWAAVFGNHDDEGPFTRAELMVVERGIAGCLSEPGPVELPGIGNYVVDIQRSRGPELSARLYFLDSGSYGPKDISTYDWIRSEQTQWFKSKAVEAGNRPGLVFLHIPLPEYDQVWRVRPCFGNKLENVSSPSLNSGFFSALFETATVMGVFAGHDHLNDYEGDLHGIRLCYGRAGGFNCYGREGFLRGARLIRLREGARHFDTWLYLEDGSRVTDPPRHDP